MQTVRSLLLLWKLHLVLSQFRNFLKHSVPGNVLTCPKICYHTGQGRANTSYVYIQHFQCTAGPARTILLTYSFYPCFVPWPLHNFRSGTECVRSRVASLCWNCEFVIRFISIFVYFIYTYCVYFIVCCQWRNK